MTNVGSFSSFVTGGIVSKQSDWPWHATIFLRPRSDREFTYSCGGSLIKPYGSKGFLVVTAAHCVATARSAARNVNDVVISLGSEESSLQGIEDHSPDAKVYKVSNSSIAIRSNSCQLEYTDRIVYQVKEIVLHKSYGGSSNDFQSDIALIRLTEPVQIKPNILPICLSKSEGLARVGEVGHVSYLRVESQDISKALAPVSSDIRIV